MLKAVFYARFHPERGPSIVHKYPRDAAGVRSQNGKSLFEWSEISSYVIPPYDLCNQSLSVCANSHRVLGFPISLEDAEYQRNRFTFNVCFVLAKDEDTHLWEQVVRKTAHFFKRLEQEDGLLRAEEELEGLRWAEEDGYPVEGVGIVYTLLQSIVEDLNACGEACIRVDDVHILNLVLADPESRPPRVRAWDVPLLIRTLPEPEEWTWDLTLQRIRPHLDGVKHVLKIAELADVELRLAKNVVWELIRHGRAILLDIFHFRAIYASSKDLAQFLQDHNVQDECRKYIAATAQDLADSEQSKSAESPSRECVVKLYCSLQPGVCLADFCANHKDELRNIDVRRFITFGIIKGFLRRIHKYALALDPPPPVSSPVSKRRDGLPGSKPKSSEEILRDFDRAWKKAVLSSGWATPPSGPLLGSLGKSHKSADDVRSDEDDKLRTYLDGTHCLDQICVEMHLSEKKVVERLRSGRLGEVILFNK